MLSRYIDPGEQILHTTTHAQTHTHTYTGFLKKVLEETKVDRNFFFGKKCVFFLWIIIQWPSSTWTKKILHPVVAGAQGRHLRDVFGFFFPPSPISDIFSPPPTPGRRVSSPVIGNWWEWKERGGLLSRQKTLLLAIIILIGLCHHHTGRWSDYMHKLLLLLPLPMLTTYWLHMLLKVSDPCTTTTRSNLESAGKKKTITVLRQEPPQPHSRKFVTVLTYIRTV